MALYCVAVYIEPLTLQHQGSLRGAVYFDETDIFPGSSLHLPFSAFLSWINSRANMTCKLCSIFLTRQKTPENLSAPLEDLKTSGEEGCDGCQLVATSIKHFFREELRQELRPRSSWKVSPVWRLGASWRQDPGIMSLAEIRQPDDDNPDRYQVEFYHGTIYMYCTPGVSKEIPKLSYAK